MELKDKSKVVKYKGNLYGDVSNKDVKDITKLPKRVLHSLRKLFVEEKKEGKKNEKPSDK